jgi:hypothetical protein
MGVIGSILIKLGLQTAEFDDGVKKAQRGMREVAKTGKEFKHVSHDISLMTESMAGSNPVLGEMGRGIKGVVGLFYDMAAAEAVALAPFVIIAASIAIISSVVEKAQEKIKELEKDQKEWATQQKEINKLINGDESGHSSKYDKIAEKLQEMKEKARDARSEIGDFDYFRDSDPNSDKAIQAGLKARALQGDVDALQKALDKQGKTDAIDKQKKSYEEFNKAIAESQKEIATFGMNAREKHIWQIENDAGKKGLEDPQTKALIEKMKYNDAYLDQLETEKKKQEDIVKLAEQHAKTIQQQWQALQNEYTKLTDKHSEKDIKLNELAGLGATKDELQTFSDLLDKIDDKRKDDEGLKTQLSAMEQLTKEAEKLLDVQDQTELKREEWQKKLGANYGAYADIINKLITPKSQQVSGGSPMDTSKLWEHFQTEALKGKEDETPKLTLAEIQKLNGNIADIKINGLTLKG